jgi:predicted ferric reductase
MMASPGEQALKLMLLFMLTLVGLAGYIFATHDTSRGVLISAGAVGLIVLVGSILEIRRDPWSYLHLVTIVVLTVAIFAGVSWWNLKTPALGWVTAVAAPIGLLLSVWSVLGKKPGGAR